MELERVQRKNRVMEETLLSDLAEQIEENDNSLLDDLTEDRCVAIITAIYMHSQ